MGAFNDHALQRLLERFEPEEQEDIKRRINKFMVEDMRPDKSYAVRVLHSQRLRGTTAIAGNRQWSDTSNGTVGFCIIRDGEVKTSGWRGATQPFNRASMHVDLLAVV